MSFQPSPLLHPEEAPASAPERRYDIDWLRIAAVLLLIPFHSARVFDPEDFYVQSDRVSEGLFGFIVFVANWHMPLLFVLAGSSVWLAMRRRGAGMFAKERLQRLLLPFLFGLVVIVPPQSWLGYLSHGIGASSFLAYYPRFWTTVDPDFAGYHGGWTPAHLWFVLWLLVLSLLALPLFVCLRGTHAGQRVLDLLARPRRLPAILVLTPALLVLTEPLDLMEVTNQNIVWFLLFVIAGFVLVSDERIGKSLDRLWPWALGMGCAAMAWFTYRALIWSGEQPSALNDFLVNSLLREVGAWLVILGLLGMGRRWLDRPAPFLPYMAEAAYPFYILHQTVIVLLAYALVGQALPLAAEYVALVGASFLLTVLAYEGLVRRWRLVRPLFGMKPRR